MPSRTAPKLSVCFVWSPLNLTCACTRTHSHRYINTYNRASRTRKSNMCGAWTGSRCATVVIKYLALALQVGHHTTGVPPALTNEVLRDLAPHRLLSLKQDRNIAVAPVSSRPTRIGNAISAGTCEHKHARTCSAQAPTHSLVVDVKHLFVREIHQNYQA